jgi:hypothetical protein
MQHDRNVDLKKKKKKRPEKEGDTNYAGAHQGTE